MRKCGSRTAYWPSVVAGNLNAIDTIALFWFYRNYEKILKKKEEFEQMKKNADSKYEEIQSSMTETNKRRKQIINQLKKKEEELEELKRVIWHFSLFFFRIWKSTHDSGIKCIPWAPNRIGPVALSHLYLEHIG